MARFQAKTTPQLEQMLEYLGDRLGLPTNKKADLLREIATLSYWIVYQAENGFTIQAQKGGETQRLEHHLLHQLSEQAQESEGQVKIALSEEEVQRLADVLDGELHLTPALQGVLQRIAGKKRKPPKLHWNESE